MECYGSTLCDPACVVSSVLLKILLRIFGLPLFDGLVVLALVFEYILFAALILSTVDLVVLGAVPFFVCGIRSGNFLVVGSNIRSTPL